MIVLNEEEIQLAACYEKKERLAWMQEIIKDKNMDENVRPVAMSLIDKVARLSDDEWNFMKFEKDEE